MVTICTCCNSYILKIYKIKHEESAPEVYYLILVIDQIYMELNMHQINIRNFPLHMYVLID